MRSMHLKWSIVPCRPMQGHNSVPCDSHSHCQLACGIRTFTLYQKYVSHMLNCMPLPQSQSHCSCRDTLSRDGKSSCSGCWIAPWPASPTIWTTCTGSPMLRSLVQMACTGATSGTYASGSNGSEDCIMLSLSRVAPVLYAYNQVGLNLNFFPDGLSSKVSKNGKESEGCTLPAWAIWHQHWLRNLSRPRSSCAGGTWSRARLT